MLRKRKDVLEKLESLAPQVEKHVARILSSSGHSSRNKWKSEALGWLSQMEALLSHVGKKTAAEWQTRIDSWRAALAEAQDAE